MKFLRHKEFKQKVLWFTTIIIVLSFGVFGTAYLLTGISGQTAYAGAIFGEKIKTDDFFKNQKHVEIQAQMRYGENYVNVRDYLNLDGDTWDRLVLLHEADRRKIKISNENVVNSIQRLPYFQRNGQFDTLTYNDVLRYVFRIKPRDFEEGVRDNLKMIEIFNNETRHVLINEPEVLTEFRKVNDQTQVNYTIITPNNYIDENAYDETQARLYWVENKNKFAVPASINITYFEFPFPDSPVEETPEESTDEENESPKDGVRAEVERIIEKLKVEEDFDKISTEENLEKKMTGFFSKENPDLSLGWSFEMLNSLFRIKEGQMAGPFELDDKFVVVELTEKKESYVPEYEDVLDDTKEAYLKEAAKETTKKAAEEYLTKIKNQVQDNFKETITALGLFAEQTPSFSRGEYLPGIGISPEFENAAFSLDEENKLSGVVETDIGYAILSLEKYTTASEEEFEKQKAQIESALLQKSRNKAFGKFVTNLRTEAKLYDNISRMRQAQQAQQQVAQ